ncbi:transketolase [Geobacter sp. DSM 9736]|uniref:transketolase n=1 Tax=Geobacter sp. DSM 9736 TaxID=1277350 RepID=UPI001E6375FB|nr:transketolase [Geobacter sp. DSM 9736]
MGEREFGELDLLCVNTIRFLSVDAVENAASGHPGMPLGAAPMAYVLWSRFLRCNPSNPSWFNRDRFVLSAGHGSALLYALLHLAGYDLSLDELRRFRQWGSLTPGHPERGHVPGVEMTTGPLGQGLANMVGIAMAEAHMAARYNRQGFPVVDHWTYGIAGDGDLMEGVAAEAASLAGHLRLGKLICLYDDNRMTLAAAAGLSFTEDRAARFQAYGWHVTGVEDGNDLAAINNAIEEARRETTRPSLIIVRTILGYGSPNRQNTPAAHGSPLGREEVRLTKERLGWPDSPTFLVPEEAVAFFREAVGKGAMAEEKWHELYSSYEEAFPCEAAELGRMMCGKLPDGWDARLPEYGADAKGKSTRAVSGEVLNVLASVLPGLLGGSADLESSTMTILKEMGDFASPSCPVDDRQGAAGGTWGYAGRNIHFGVREHGMAAVMNGIAGHGGLIPFGSTFLVFSDYLKPALRLAALMGLHVIHVFTHDSIAVGEDGPTHQPVEQLAGLRAIPRLLVIRPGDANETVAAWRTAVTAEGPVVLVLSRQNVPILDRARFASAEGVARGGYVLADMPGGEPQLILIASGSEVPLIAAAWEKLVGMGVAARAVSMPCWELFLEQPQDYRDTVLPPQVEARLAVEAGTTQGWHRFVGSRGLVIGVDRFGSSAPGDEVMERYGFTVEHVTEAALELAGVREDG